MNLILALSQNWNLCQDAQFKTKNLVDKILSSGLRCLVCFNAYNFIPSQDTWLKLKDKCYKKLVKQLSLPPTTTVYLEIKLTALKN